MTDERARARDAHRSAALLALLVFLWGAVSLLVDPWRPFGGSNAIQVAFCGALLVYFVLTWKRPSRRAAEVIATIVIAYSMLRMPWFIVEWCRLGRPVDAFFIPQVAAVSLALVYPGRWWLGVTAMGVFIAECLFAIAYARHVGLTERIPITEPFATFAFAVLGTGLFMVRRRRRELANQHVRVQAEIDALERVRPLFDRTRKEIDEQLEVLAVSVDHRADTKPKAVGRALERLDDLRTKLAGLAAGTGVTASPQEAERRLLAHDAQLGALLFGGITAAVAIPAWAQTYSLLGEVPPTMLAQFLIAFAIAAYLVATRRRPSSRRALWAVLALFATQLVAVTLNDVWLLALNRPYAPLLGHKLLMGVLGLTLATRFKLGVVLVTITAVNALVLWFALDMAAHRDIIPLGEPVDTLVYTLIGLASLRMLEQRQIASIQLLRAETEASAMHRRALLFLALRDRLNSPLQTLVLGASLGAESGLALDRLVRLSRELGELDLVAAPSMSLDPERELRRQF